MWNWSPEAEGLAIVAIFIVIAAFASWRIGKPGAQVLASKAAARAAALRAGSTGPILGRASHRA